MICKSLVVSAPGENETNAAMLVQTASIFDSRIHVTFLNHTVNAKSIMGVMTLPLENGDQLTVQADGHDEEKAINALTAFFQGRTVYA